MKLAIERAGEETVVKPSGRLDMNASPDLRKAALSLYVKHKCKNLTLDFSNVSFIDTSGLATLLEILLVAKEHSAQLALRGLNEEVRYLIDVNGLMPFFHVSDSARSKSHA